MTENHQSASIRGWLEVFDYCAWCAYRVKCFALSFLHVCVFLHCAYPGGSVTWLINQSIGLLDQQSVLSTAHEKSTYQGLSQLPMVINNQCVHTHGFRYCFNLLGTSAWLSHQCKLSYVMDSYSHIRRNINHSHDNNYWLSKHICTKFSLCKMCKLKWWYKYIIIILLLAATAYDTHTHTHTHTGRNALFTSTLVKHWLSGIMSQSTVTVND